MKKMIAFCTVLFFAFIGVNQTNAQSFFPDALKNCEKYSNEGSAEKYNEVFNISITLEKAKNNKCVYKEKIYQDDHWELLTCNFEPSQLTFMSNSMKRFNEVFAKEIAKNRIFEAKMTTNGEIFQKYLANPKYCTITHSKK